MKDLFYNKVVRNTSFALTKTVTISEISKIVIEGTAKFGPLLQSKKKKCEA